MDAVENHIIAWLTDYCRTSRQAGFIVGISGGVDSAVTSWLCAKTGLKTILLGMPLHQQHDQLVRARDHMKALSHTFPNVECLELDLTSAFEAFRASMPEATATHLLSMANTRSRLRMTTLYAVGQANGCLVVGTGNKVEDFGVGFYTKYGDGGVDISPIADLTKTEVWALAKHVGVSLEIISAKPTDGLWGEDRTDEQQLGATYPELEWAMDYSGDESILNEREQEVLSIYRRFNALNRHKMQPIPVCKIPQEIRNQ
jgi:NAD+ synthase